MKHKTKPTGKPADYYVLGLIPGGIVFWILAGKVRLPAAIFQLVALCMFAAALFILIRYRLTVFSLRIEGKNGSAVDVHTAMPHELDLVIERMRGNGAVALARLSLDLLKWAEVIKYDRLKEIAGGASVFRYQADMSPEEGILLVFRMDGRDVAIFTDLPPEMFNFLKRIAESNLGEGTSK